jgi:hypothetical protein
MKTFETSSNKDHAVKNSVDHQKGIDHHKKAASHFEEAAKSHLDAAKHHESGNQEKAAKSTLEAQNHSAVAHEAQKEVVKNHKA